MKKMLFCLGLLSFSSYSTLVDAQDIDLDSDEKKTKKKKKQFKAKIDQDVREIERGFYAKSSIGGVFFVLDYGSYVQPGTALALTFGQDYVDREKHSFAWEVSFSQGIHNGTYYEIQADLQCYNAGNCTQGDLRTYSFIASNEFSFYPSKRIGLGLRVGGGVMFSPLLMNEKYYNEEVVPKWGNVPSSVHTSPHPLALGGLAFEYYTKLSHFSIGVDADAMYAIGFDLGVAASGYLKYTF
jgi:hypothetical protein